MQFLGLTVRSGPRGGRCVCARGGSLPARAPTLVRPLPAPSLMGRRPGLTFLCRGVHFRPGEVGVLLEPLGAPPPASGGLFSSLLSKLVVC